MNKIQVFLKKKINLPIILEVMQKFAPKKYEWLGNLKMEFMAHPIPKVRIVIYRDNL